MRRLGVIVRQHLIAAVWAFLAGVLFLFAYPPFNQSYLAWLGLVPVFFLARREYSFWSGYIWGLTFFGFSLFWVARLSGIGWFCGVLYLSLYPAIFFFLVSRPLVKLYELWVASVGVIIEFLSGNLLTGFPWFSLAVTQHQKAALLALASYGGAYLVSFLIILVNVIIFTLLFRREKRSVFYGLALGAVLLTLGITRSISSVNRPDVGVASGLKFAAVQGNVPSSLRQQGPTLEPYLKITRKLSEKVDLIIWPETTFVSEEGTIPSSVKNLVRAKNAYLLSGVLEGRGGQLYNSVFLCSPRGKVISIYRKRHLVPFGEFTPARNLALIRFLVGRQAGYVPDLQRGLWPGRMEVKGEPLSIFICYEDIFPEEVAAAIGARGPTIMVTLTNDSWLGLLGSYQHFGAASLRAAENGSFLIRAANTGVTAYFDENGRVIGKIPVRQPGILIGEAKIVTTGKTYQLMLPDKSHYIPDVHIVKETFYQRFPLLVPWVCIVFSIILFFFKRRRV